MKNYKQSSKKDHEIILKFLKDRMKDQKITQKKLAEITGVSVGSLIRYFSSETQMPLGLYLEILGVLELRPYLVPKEMDKIGMKSVHYFD
ncbi:MAG: helix-turn-helix transcriptional regulator [Flavobacteriaceae bacterium]|nr:helix-turn-helix transcriptional regulator [Flavobacteriaceae bacterium]